jgi:hypothetical protein
MKWNILKTPEITDKNKSISGLNSTGFDKLEKNQLNLIKGGNLDGGDKGDEGSDIKHL